MINPEELAICRKRGHGVRSLSNDQRWDHCPECGAWVRQLTTVAVEEREDEPPEADMDPLFRAKLDMKRIEKKRALNKAEPEMQPVDQEQLVICKRRGHEMDGYTQGWAPCAHCNLWVREVTTVKVEEREDEPPEEEMTYLLISRRRAAAAR